MNKCRPPLDPITISPISHMSIDFKIILKKEHILSSKSYNKPKYIIYVYIILYYIILYFIILHYIILYHIT